MAEDHNSTRSNVSHRKAKKASKLEVKRQKHAKKLAKVEKKQAKLSK